MNTNTNNEDDWKQRMLELEEKNKYYKLKRREKNELKSLHKKYNEILSIKTNKAEEEKKKAEEEKKKAEEEKKKKEEEMKKQKKLILERQKEYRKAQYQNIINSKKPEKVEEVLEDMCILGSIMKEEIIEEKKSNPEKFISIEEATKEENKSEGTFCLGVLAQNLESMGITTAIEKNSSQDDDSQNSANTVLQFITNGMIEKKK